MVSRLACPATAYTREASWGPAGKLCLYSCSHLLCSAERQGGREDQCIMPTGDTKIKRVPI
jgi:hypothetical protein